MDAMPQRALVEVKESDGAVELSVTQEGQDPLVVVLDPAVARSLGDQMFKAGCNCSP